MRKAVRAAKDPNVILSVYGDIGAKSHPPLRRNLREVQVLFELWQSALADVQGLCRRRLTEHGLG